jgi:hypothetical protein
MQSPPQRGGLGQRGLLQQRHILERGQNPARKQKDPSFWSLSVLTF